MSNKIPYSEINYDGYLKLHDNSMQSCSICGHRIPKQIQRLRYEKFGFQQSSVFTVCAICLWQLGKKVNKKKVKELMEARFVEQL